MFLAAVQIAGPLLRGAVPRRRRARPATRVAPALNAFALGFPLKILMTLMLAGVVFLALPGVVASASATGRRHAAGGGLMADDSGRRPSRPPRSG